MMCEPIQTKKSKRVMKPVAPTDTHAYNTMPEHKVIWDLVQRGAIFVINHSAGKDSQAMTLLIQHSVPKEQVVVVHAALGKVEWDGCIEHIYNTVKPGTEFIVCRNPNKDFITMVQHRGMFPDASRRQCTSDLKRGPIETAIRRMLKRKGKSLVVNCMGMRAEESDNRADMQTFSYNARNSKAGREWYDWLPLHKMTTEQVFAFIYAFKQKPHFAYALGMTRLSCCFCIMASQSDLIISAKANPHVYNIICTLEVRYGFTLQMSKKTLPEITGIPFEMVEIPTDYNDVEVGTWMIGENGLIEMDLVVSNKSINFDKQK